MCFHANAPPSRRAELPLADSSEEHPWRWDSAPRSGCSAGKVKRLAPVRTWKLYLLKVYLDHPLVSLQDGVHVRLGSLLLHQHHLHTLCWQSVAERREEQCETEEGAAVLLIKVLCQKKGSSSVCSLTCLPPWCPAGCRGCARTVSNVPPGSCHGRTRWRWECRAPCWCLPGSASSAASPSSS